MCKVCVMLLEHESLIREIILLFGKQMRPQNTVLHARTSIQTHTREKKNANALYSHIQSEAQTWANKRHHKNHLKVMRKKLLGTSLIKLKLDRVFGFLTCAYPTAFVYGSREMFATKCMENHSITMQSGQAKINRWMKRRRKKHFFFKFV